MVWGLDLVLRTVSIIIGLVSVLYGSLIVIRFSEKLKTAVIFLILSVVATLVLNIFNIFKFALINLDIVRSIGNLSVTIFVLLTLFFLKQMIDRVDNHYSKR